MADRWQTFRATFNGGLTLNQDALTLGSQNPGAAVIHTNYEPSLLGGYRRVNGYQKFDEAIVPGSGPLMDVALFKGGVIAVRANSASTMLDFWYSTGNGWGTKINTVQRNWVGVDKVRHHSYDWVQPTVVFVDGVNPALKWDGTNWTTITGTGCPADPSIVTTFSSRLVLAGYSSNRSAFSVSVANNDINFAPAGGAFEVAVGDPIVAMRNFRETLYIFCRNSIHKLEGNSINNFKLSPVTQNIGCVSGDSVQEVGGDLLFLAPDGIRPVSATERIGDVELATVSREVWPYLRELTTTKDPTRYCSTVIRSKNQYRLFANDINDTPEIAEGLIGGIRNGPEGLKWEWSKLQGFHVACADTGYVDEDEYIVHGGFDGYVYHHDVGNSRDGQPIYSQTRLPHLNFDDANIRKTLYKLDLYYRIEGQTEITLATIIDYSGMGSLQPPAQHIGTSNGGIAIYGTPSFVYGQSKYGATNIPVAQEYLIGSGFTFAFDFVTNDVNPPHTLQAYTIEYGVSGRR